jgi:hypothetical protein
VATWAVKILVQALRVKEISWLDAGARKEEVVQLLGGPEGVVDGIERGRMLSVRLSHSSTVALNARVNHAACG